MRPAISNDKTDTSPGTRPGTEDTRHRLGRGTRGAQSTHHTGTAKLIPNIAYNASITANEPISEGGRYHPTGGWGLGRY